MVIKVLMLDNEYIFSLITKKYFVNKEIKIITSTTSSKAWLELLKVTPDLIIVDILMPKTTGYDFIEKIKLHEKFKHIPFIFLTAKGLTQDRIKGHKLGCNAYVSKPFEPEELEQIIKNIVSQKKTSMEWLIKTYGVLKKMRLKLINKNTILKSKYLLYEQLTKTELEILKKLISGKKNNEIASILNVSTRHIEKYVCKILEKTQLNNRNELQNKYSWILD